MKYCPNPSCRTLLDLGMVAEYEDHVDFCVDCGAALIAAEAPPQITPQPVPDAIEDEQQEEQREERRLRYCPNPDCPILVEKGFVAEYDEQVEYCEHCGAQLVRVYAAEEPTPQPEQPEGQPGDSENETALLGSFVAWEDVALCLRAGERIGIPITVMESTVELDSDEDGPHERAIVSAFDLVVRKRDLFRAMQMLDDLFSDDAGASGEDEEGV